MKMRSTRLLRKCIDVQTLLKIAIVLPCSSSWSTFLFQINQTLYTYRLVYLKAVESYILYSLHFYLFAPSLHVPDSILFLP